MTFKRINIFIMCNSKKVYRSMSLYQYSSLAMCIIRQILSCDIAMFCSAAMQLSGYELQGVKVEVSKLICYSL